MAFSSAPLLAATPVIDLDGTFFVQGGMFLLMVVLLRPLLFKPWIRAMERRTAAIDGARTEAERLRTEADQVGADYDRKLAEARERAAVERSKAQREEEARRDAELAAARQEAEADLTRRRMELEREARQARTELASRVAPLAEDIVRRILGRAA